MCGRYSLTADLAELAGRFEFDGDWDAFERRYNIAPTQEVLTVVGGEKRRGGFMRWGLIPHWAKDSKIGSRMINARAETVAEKPSFRTALRRRRCLVLADGFYEWQRVGKNKRPMRIVLRSGEPFAFAGLWSVWRDPNSNRVPSCTIITTAANDQLSPIHDRMPVILPRDLEELWLDTRVDDPSALDSILTPYPGDEMDAYEVSPLVNSAANNQPEVIARVA
ncbi:MAG: SOS response-associated peptidase [Gemmatimonadetes bacterium]|nr:SOS response-associated peptidase [Gemmatimonadota bacterium]